MTTTPTIRPARGRRRFTLAVAGVALLGAAALAAPAAWIHHAAAGRIVAPDATGDRPVALVLGAAVQPDGRPSPFLRARLDVAGDLYRRGAVQRLIVSGDDRDPDFDEPAVMRDHLVRSGIPAEVIVLDGAGYDTHRSCVRAVDVHGVHRLVVVSQSYHLPRALALCRHAGIDAVGVGDDSVRDLAPEVWRAGELRELPAGTKAALDVLTGRRPAEPVPPG